MAPLRRQISQQKVMLQSAVIFLVDICTVWWKHPTHHGENAVERMELQRSQREEGAAETRR